MKTSVAVLGDVTNINTWSNIPYFFYHTGKKINLFNIPWKLDINQFRHTRKLWNCKEILLLKGKGGFQYSDFFLSKAEAAIPDKYKATNVITFNQLFPRAQSIKKHGGNIYYYIDFTLYSLFNSHSYRINISKKKKQKAMELEKKNYQLAKKIVVMASWNVEILKNIYHIPVDKIHIILPGANIQLPNNFHFSNPKNKTFTIGFIGKDWERKGLVTLNQIAGLLHRKGLQVEIKAIGFPPEQTNHLQYIKALGFINKHKETSRFIEFIQSCDLGCLFSDDEALGISTLEFLRLGVPVAGYYHQGLKDTLLNGASLRFLTQDTNQIIADYFFEYINNKKKQTALRNKAIEYAEFVNWDRCIKEWQNILNC